MRPIATAGNPETMSTGDPLDNVVLFETGSDGEPLRKRLQADWLVWFEQREGTQLLAASLRAEPHDIAVLLRTVEAWADERGLSSLRFRLDGRPYTLRLQAAAPA